ncbi:MAG: hypothetical protein BMS9Abin37_3202 [Acidobacteriota bacterium]|nr:MAG: hypothetical protein BMS9Abin37_3202 [Acidobacteriota bacterium]
MQLFGFTRIAGVIFWMQKCCGVRARLGRPARTPVYRRGAEQSSQPSAIDVDVSFGSLPFEEETIETADVVEVSGIRLRLPRSENLLVMKAVANRPRDLADIEALVDGYPELDRKKVRSWVREFSSILEMPEIFDHVDSLLKRPRKHLGARKK